MTTLGKSSVITVALKSVLVFWTAQRRARHSTQGPTKKCLKGGKNLLWARSFWKQSVWGPLMWERWVYTSFPGFCCPSFPSRSPSPGGCCLSSSWLGWQSDRKTVALLPSLAGPLLVSITGSKRRGKACRVTNTVGRCAGRRQSSVEINLFIWVPPLMSHSEREKKTLRRGIICQLFTSFRKKQL